MITRRLLITSIILTVATALVGCYTHLNERPAISASVDDYPIDRVIEDIVYSAADWPQPLMADLYLPQRPGLHPVVLMIHGGGWANRSRDDMTGISRKLARNGYAVFNVSYRFAPRYTYPAQLHDMAQALQWIDANAQEYNLDTERLNAWGYSSGAHLAALIASIDKPGTSLDATAPLPRIQSRPA
jgi:acetyl esterase/lipase